MLTPNQRSNLQYQAPEIRADIARNIIADIRNNMLDLFALAKLQGMDKVNQQTLHVVDVNIGLLYSLFNVDGT